MHVIVAVRGGETSKSRCAGILTPPERQKLVFTMLEDVLATIKQSSLVSKVHVVTPTTEIAALASGSGAKVVWETSAGGLNNAFRLGLDQVQSVQGGGAVMLLPGDLPLIKTSDLDKVVLRHAAGNAVVIPSLRDGGTNALAFETGNPLPLCFGPDSLQKHLSAAHENAVELSCVDAPSIAFDVDLPRDIYTVQCSTTRTRTGRFLATVLKKDVPA